MDVPVELVRIVISETSPRQLIYLREIGGERNFPIVIGISEALAIDRRLKGVDMPRPMTHDLLARIIEALGARLQRVVINDLRDQTFIASLFIERDGEVIEVDSRPSDAIALGVASRTPLYVADHVLEEAISPPDLESQRENLVQRRYLLVDAIREVRTRLTRVTSDKVAGPKDEEKAHVLQNQLTEMQAELEIIEEILRSLPESPPPE